MKKIYTLAIALMSGVILTACVGAVNIGGGTSPEFALINRCIVGNTAQADPTCAKAVADTNGCINDPFSSGCEANPIFSPHVQNARDERVKFCNDVNNAEDSLCTRADSVKDICTHNPFGKICDGFYYQARKEICEDDLTFPRCTDTVIDACDADPFNTNLCFQDSTYNDKREGECRYSRSTTERCAPTVKRVCNADPFNIAVCFSGDTYDSLRETNCADESTSSRCKTTVSRVCFDNAFHGLCDNNPKYEPVRINDCIIAGNAGELRCTGAFDANSCVLNPFGTSCNNESYISDARMNRLNFCSNIKNTKNSICAFVSACLENPFASICRDDIFNKKRDSIIFCNLRTNANKESCSGVISQPNVASWLQSFPTELRKTPNPIQKNEFLQIDREVTTGFQGIYFDTTSNTTGVSFATRNGSDNSSNNYFYAGLQNIGLGAPRTETSGSATWDGYFGSVRAFSSSNSGGGYTNFQLTVNFGAGSESGQIEAFVRKGDNSAPAYYLKGDFNNRGVITGKVTLGMFANIAVARQSDNPNGKLTGLIGEIGAVGAFISDATNHTGYAGGFVARPPSN